jgi:hypothetical protein
VAVSVTEAVVCLCCRLQLLGVVSLWAALSHGINLRKSLKGKNIGLLCTDMCFNCMCIFIDKEFYLGISRVRPAVTPNRFLDEFRRIFQTLSKYTLKVNL